MKNQLTLRAVVEALYMINDETTAYYNTETGAISFQSEYDSYDDIDVPRRAR